MKLPKLITLLQGMGTKLACPRCKQSFNPHDMDVVVQEGEVVTCRVWCSECEAEVSIKGEVQEQAQMRVKKQRKADAQALSQTDVSDITSALLGFSGRDISDLWSEATEEEPQE